MKMRNLIELIAELDIDVPTDPVNCYLRADLDMDSQELVELHTAIEKTVNTELPRPFLRDDMTILQVNDLINKHLTEGGN